MQSVFRFVKVCCCVFLLSPCLALACPSGDRVTGEDLEGQCENICSAAGCVFYYIVEDAGFEERSGSCYCQEGGNAAAGADDTDGDGLTDEEERQLGTDFGQIDTDNDGISDRWEIWGGTDPLDSDDHLSDAYVDTDDDGISDSW